MPPMTVEERAARAAAKIQSLQPSAVRFERTTLNLEQQTDYSWLTTSGAPEPVTEAVERLTAAQSRHRQVLTDLATSRSAIGAAQVADRDLAVSALEANKPEPGTPNEDQAHEALAAAERRAEASAVSVVRAHDGLLSAIADEAPAWTARVESQRSEARQTLLGALAVVDAAASEEIRLESVLDFVAQPNRRTANRRRRSPMVVLGRDLVPVGTLTAALRSPSRDASYSI